MTRNICIVISLLICFLSNAQEMKNHLNKELTANVGTLYEETPDNNPCAGSQIYLTLLFDQEKVCVSEKEISTCEKENISEIGSFNWQLLENNRIDIGFDPQKIKYTYAKTLSLELKNDTVIGKIIHLNGTTSEYIFKEHNKD